MRHLSRSVLAVALLIALTLPGGAQQKMNMPGMNPPGKSMPGMNMEEVLSKNSLSTPASVSLMTAFVQRQPHQAGSLPPRPRTGLRRL